MAEAEIEAIFTAVRRGDVEEVARILNAKPHLMEARILDSSDQMPLMMAAGRGHAGLVRLLLERGAKVNACNRYRETALLEAASGGHEEVVSILLGCGADPSRSDNANTTALINACFRDHLGVARQLIRHMQGPGLDQRNYDGSTALWWTCYNGNVEAARALLLAGADHTIVGMYGEAPRQAAELYEHPECVALLEWWEGQLERGYVMHRARRLAEQRSLLQPALDAAGTAAAAVSLASSLAGVSIPAFLRLRIPIVPPLPHVEVVRLPEDEETGASAGQGKRKVEEEGGAQGQSEAERDATVKYVMQDLHPELYIELMAGFHPMKVLQEEAANGLVF